MGETEVLVRAAYYQYYFYADGGDFDTSSVDYENDGILAPADTGARICSGAHSGKVRLTVRIIDTEIELPLGNKDIVASACNLVLPTGGFSIADWGGPAVFRHDFGRPLTCGLFIEVRDRDAAHDHRYQPDPPVEHHLITISSVALPGGRWRSSRIDEPGRRLQQYTDHVDDGTGRLAAGEQYGPGYPRTGKLVRVFRGAPDGPTFSAPPAVSPRVGRGPAGEFSVVTSGSSSNPTMVQRVHVLSETRLQLWLGRRELGPGGYLTADLTPYTSVIATDGLSESAPVTVELSWADGGPLQIIVPPS